MKNPDMIIIFEHGQRYELQGLVFEARIEGMAELKKELREALERAELAENALQVYKKEYGPKQRDQEPLPAFKAYTEQAAVPEEPKEDAPWESLTAKDFEKAWKKSGLTRLAFDRELGVYEGFTSQVLRGVSGLSDTGKKRLWEYLQGR